MAQSRRNDDLLARMQLQREAQRSAALGPLREAAGRRASDQERAIRLAADTLLDKALRRLRDGDEAAARRFVDRALRLAVPGSDAGEEGALAVHLFVWDALRDAALGGTREDWAERAAEVDGTLDGIARRAWRAALRSLADEGELAGAVQRRIRQLASGVAADRDPFDGVGHDDRVEATLRLLRGLLRLTAS
jgi:hypothetical protein